MAVVFHSVSHPPGEWLPHFERACPGLDIRAWPDIGDPAKIDIAVVWKSEPGFLNYFPNLKAILSMGAGVEHILGDPSFPVEVPLARVVDPRMISLMSEYVVFHVLRRQRRFDETRANQKSKTWAYEPPPNTNTTTVGFLGFGELGRDAAGKLAMLGFDVIGWSRSAKSIDGIETAAGPEALPGFLGRCDYLVCLLPLTAKTEDMLDAKLLKALPRGAYVINAARGALLVDEDLIAALDSGHLSGATLDVFRHEPLPADHAFWSHSKITVTPHNAADSYAEDVVPQLVENIRRVQAGEPLLNQVDVERGY